MGYYWFLSHEGFTNQVTLETLLTNNPKDLLEQGNKFKNSEINNKRTYCGIIYFPASETSWF